MTGFNEETGRFELDAREGLLVATELCRAAGVGRPTHPTLYKDIANAFAVALNSPTFRSLVAAAAEKTEGGTGYVRVDKFDRDRVFGIYRR